MKKNRHKNGVQIYKYWRCGRQFLGADHVSDEELWDEYVRIGRLIRSWRRNTAGSARTGQRRIDRYRTVAVVYSPRRVVVAMDTTYWGRNFGVMPFKDMLTGKDLMWYFVKTETVALHVKGDKRPSVDGL